MATMAAHKRVVVWRSITDHPKYGTVHRFARHNQKQCKAAMLVYLDMTEAKNVLDVGIHHNDEKRLTYFSGRENDDLLLDIFVPITTDDTLSMQRIHSLFESITHPETQRRLESIVAAIIDDDSTVVYYRIHRGIVPPPVSMIMTTGADADEEEGDGDDAPGGDGNSDDDEDTGAVDGKQKKRDNSKGGQTRRRRGGGRKQQPRKRAKRPPK